jgi:hypothetical protein
MYIVNRRRSVLPVKKDLQLLLPPMFRPTASPLLYLLADQSSGLVRHGYHTCCRAYLESAINLVTDFLGGRLPLDPDLRLKAHQLTDFQRVEQIFSLPLLGAQKPSEMLAEIHGSFEALGRRLRRRAAFHQHSWYIGASSLCLMNFYPSGPPRQSPPFTAVITYHHIGWTGTSEQIPDQCVQSKNTPSSSSNK